MLLPLLGVWARNYPKFRSKLAPASSLRRSRSSPRTPSRLLLLSMQSFYAGDPHVQQAVRPSLVAVRPIPGLRFTTLRYAVPGVPLSVLNEWCSLHHEYCTAMETNTFGTSA